jgi:hypothetical protein
MILLGLRKKFWNEIEPEINTVRLVPADESGVEHVKRFTLWHIYSTNLSIYTF